MGNILAKSLAISFILLFSLTVCGCGSSPETVMKDYIEATFDKDIKTMSKLTFRNQPMSDEDWNMQFNMFWANRLKKMEGKIDKIEIDKSEFVPGSNEMIKMMKVRVLLKGGKEMKNTFTLTKMDGSWQIVQEETGKY